MVGILPKFCQKYLQCRKRIVSKPSKISNPYLTTLIEDLNKKYKKISCSYLYYFPRIKPPNNVTVGPGSAESGRFIILNDLAITKMITKINSNFSDFIQDFRVVSMSSRLPIYDWQYELSSLRSLVIIYYINFKLPVSIYWNHNKYYQHLFFVNKIDRSTLFARHSGIHLFP